jgi:hypothetical protein
MRHHLIIKQQTLHLFHLFISPTKPSYFSVNTSQFLEKAQEKQQPQFIWKAENLSFCSLLSPES